MNGPLLSPGSCSDGDTISVVAHQGSTQSWSSQRPFKGTDTRTNNARNSWRNSSSSSTSSNRPAQQIPSDNSKRANSFRSSSLGSDAPANSPEQLAISEAKKVVKPLSLSGNSILRVVPIGSSQDLDEVEWSSTLGKADDFSIRDPHFDLTSAKMTKLFSLCRPNGACQKSRLGWYSFVLIPGCAQHACRQ
ncbi:unnamed protein product [Phytophthora fragariaefolia]|uniref:Unnamed protein product n=1 Tax=Phytophthora fragariaefolia TaxID=1490495 RepID=A0A9W6YQI2_9STRA|nr:unnamed protein product [Phytophthora fragariaefolia]